MTKLEVRNIYKRLLDHPKLSLMPEYYQEIIGDLAYGMTQMDIARDRKISRARIWQVRNQIFVRLGLRLFDNGKTRAMTVTEVSKKLLPRTPLSRLK